jgi:hypothetical protein
MGRVEAHKPCERGLAESITVGDLTVAIEGSAVVASIRKAVQLVDAVLEGSRTAVSRLDAKPVVGLYVVVSDLPHQQPLSRG